MIKWLAILAVVAIGAVSFHSCRDKFKNPFEAIREIGTIPIDNPQKPLSAEDRENEIRALGGICLVDAAGEKPAAKQTACKRLMENALRYKKKYNDNLDAIFRLAKTLYPRERTVPKGWAERSVAFVFRPTLFLGYRKADRVAALNLAKQLYEAPVPPGCATHNTRAPRETTDVYDERAGAKALKETMYEVPESDPILIMRSYCAREDAPKK